MPVLYRTDIASDADLKVHVTDIRSEADLVIYETGSRWEATEPQIWHYTDVRSDADRTVYMQASQWEADLIVYKTDIASDAGWSNTGKQHLL